MIVTHIGSRLTKQIRMDIYRSHDACQYKQKLHVLIGRIARIKQVHAVVRGDGPIVMFAGTVYPGIRFFM